MASTTRRARETADLRTRYLGLTLRSPIVASASPLTRALDLPDASRRPVRRRSSCCRSSRKRSSTRRLQLNRGPRSRLRALRRGPRLLPCRRRLLGRRATQYLARPREHQGTIGDPDHRESQRGPPAVGSATRGSSSDAGADAIELNLYHVAADPARLSPRYRERRPRVRRGRARRASPSHSRSSSARTTRPWPTSRPRSSPWAPTASCCSTASTNPTSTSSRSTSWRGSSSANQWELRLPLRWIAILRPLLAARASLAATTGISDGTDVVKALMVGADVAMLTSAILGHGPAYLATVESELQAWLDDRDYRICRRAARQRATRRPVTRRRSNGPIT